MGLLHSLVRNAVKHIEMSSSSSSPSLSSSSSSSSSPMLTLSLWSSSSLRWRAGSYEPFHAPFLFYTRFLPSHSSLYPSFIVVPTFHRQSHSPPSHPLSTGTPTLHYRTHTPPLHPLSTITPTFYHRTHALLSHPRPTVSPTLHHLTHAPPLSPRSAVAPTLYCRTQFSIYIALWQLPALLHFHLYLGVHTILTIPAINRTSFLLKASLSGLGRFIPSPKNLLCSATELRTMGQNQVILRHQ